MPSSDVPWNGGYVTSCAADTDACANDLNQACDGREDCPDGQSCCITVLASSGNDGFCDSMGWPACITSVISVGG